MERNPVFSPRDHSRVRKIRNHASIPAIQAYSRHWGLKYDALPMGVNFHAQVAVTT